MIRALLDVLLGALVVAVGALARAMLRLRDRVLELELARRRRDPPFE